jgi:Fic family protein
MAPTFKDFSLRLVQPSFDSLLLDALMELNHLRRLELHGSTPPWMFFQLKEIFHLLESVGSARIEGNRTTISEYVEQKLEHGERSAERFSEIANVEQAMLFIEENIDEGSDITHHFIRELHHLSVDRLNEEGDRTPGAYRTWEVEIVKSDHLPPDPLRVMELTDELLNFINRRDDQKYDLIKIALAHHRFAWIHPFGNGNGRVVRLLTYTLLIKYGFRVKDGQLINPTAVFCNDREKYYEELAIADRGTDESLLQWCEYVLTGICEEISKVNKLLDHDYSAGKVLIPALARGRTRGLISKEEESILKIGITNSRLKALDIKRVLPRLNSRQRTHMIKKLKSIGLIIPIRENGREYFVNFNNKYLMRSLIEVLEQENFIPPINE